MSMDEKKRCPRCAGPMPKRDIECAISRRDSATRICSDCGNAEALGGLSRPWADSRQERIANERAIRLLATGRS